MLIVLPVPIGQPVLGGSSQCREVRQCCGDCQWSGLLSGWKTASAEESISPGGSTSGGGSATGGVSAHVEGTGSVEETASAVRLASAVGTAIAEGKGQPMLRCQAVCVNHS